MQKIVLPIEIIELEEGNYHIMVNSQFSDKSSGKWVIDTGASKSVFDKSLEKYYKIVEADSGNEMFSAGIGVDSFETITGEIRKLKFGDLKVKKFRVALIGLNHINELYNKYASEKICGLIGSDFLKKHEAVIDYRKKLLRLRKD
jgi:hypothetical protein